MLCFRSLATHFLKKVLAATIYYGNNKIQKLYIIVVDIELFAVIYTYIDTHGIVNICVN